MKRSSPSFATTGPEFAIHAMKCAPVPAAVAGRPTDGEDLVAELAKKAEAGFDAPTATRYGNALAVYCLLTAS